jgi:hypothetical protein
MKSLKIPTLIALMAVAVLQFLPFQKADAHHHHHYRHHYGRVGYWGHHGYWR